MSGPSSALKYRRTERIPVSSVLAPGTARSRAQCDRTAVRVTRRAEAVQMGVGGWLLPVRWYVRLRHDSDLAEHTFRAWCPGEPVPAGAVDVLCTGGVEVPLLG